VRRRTSPGLTGQRSQRSRRAGTALAAAAALLLSGAGLLTTAGTAAADDPGGLQAQIDAAKTELATLQDQTEQVAERMNAARIAQGGAERKAAAAQARLREVDVDVAAQRAAIGDLAVRSFEAATDRTITLLGSQDPAVFLARASDLAEVARTRTQALDALRAASKRQTDARTAASTAVAESSQVTAQVAAEQRSVEAGLASQRRVLGDLQARQAELVRQAEEAARKAAAEQAAAEAQAAADRRAADARAEQQRLDAQAAAVAAASVPVAATTPAPTGQSVTEVAVLPTGTTLPSPTAAVAQAAPPAAEAPPAPPVRSGDAASVAIAAARAQLGKPYVYGAAGPDSFDCSGLTQWAYGKAGIALSHYTGAQWNEGRHVSQSELAPGDLVFFYSDLHHVVIYVGGGEMIDAPHSGASVRQEPLFGGYAGAVRPGG